MDSRVMSPVNVAYRGSDADQHKIDLVQVGQSLAGIGRLYNSVAHFYFHGKIPARNYQPIIRTYTAEPQAGCVNFVLIASILHEHLPTYSEIIFKFADAAISKIIGAIFAKRTGHLGEMEKALEVIRDMHERDTSLMAAVLNKDAVTTGQLVALVDKLATNNRASMAEMVAPVGHSCRTLTHFDKTDRRIIIDEPIAEVMRSKENLEVGNQTEIAATIMGVDRGTGSCRVEFADGRQVVRGKITDPALKNPHNVYTHALDTQSVVLLTAKPVMRDGEITRLYISDAKKP